MDSCGIEVRLDLESACVITIESWFGTCIGYFLSTTPVGSADSYSTVRVQFQLGADVFHQHNSPMVCNRIVLQSPAYSVCTRYACMCVCVTVYVCVCMCVCECAIITLLTVKASVWHNGIHDLFSDII